MKRFLYLSKAVIFATILLGVKVNAFAISFPTFTGGSPQSISICQDVVSDDISTLLTVNDPSMTAILTWSQFVGTPNGTVTGSYTAPANGGNVTLPSGTFTYSPAPGFSGADSFVIMVNDGMGGTAFTQINVTVNPTPFITSTLDTTICGDSILTYTPTFNTGPTTAYSWSRAVAVGISNPAKSGTSTIVDTLVNTDTQVRPAIYTFFLSAMGCTNNTQSLTDSVVPTRLLTSPLVIGAICSGVPFTYMATSGVPGVSYQWNSIPVSGVPNTGKTGSTNPLVDTLTNTTALPIVVTYNYSVTYANGMGAACYSKYNVVDTVEPTPTLPGPLTYTVCDSTAFIKDTVSLTPGTTYSWSRATVPGISNPYSSGGGATDTLRDTLINTTSSPVAVVYTDTLTAHGCRNIEYVTVTVNPRAMLSPGSITPPAICNNDTFRYKPTFTTGPGTSFAWSRGTSFGKDSIKEQLQNTTATPIVVTYVDTLTIYGCINLENLSVTVNPTPRLNSSATPPAICSGDIFNYTPTSGTVGASYIWTRAYVLGIDFLAGSGIDNPNEQLINTTYVNVNVVYVYTVSANGCTHAPDSVTVTVHPVPTLSSPLNVTICSGAPFSYIPESHTPSPQVTYTWTRAAVAGITPATGSGTTNINETLTDGTTTAKTVAYTYILKVDGVCPHTQNVSLTVNPGITPPVISIKPSANLCSNTHYMNFGDTSAPSAGTTYNWSAINGTVWATGANRQNSIISFNNPGQAWVVLTNSIGTTSCHSTDTFAVTVGTGVSDVPQVIRYNGQFMCLQNNVDTYQWGYDDATTLDSTLVQGEVNQVYFNANPDLIHNYYWVMTTKGSCLQKTYYNVPLGITNVNEIAGSVKVYPNPASNNINVEVNGAFGGNMEIVILNLLGQRVNSTPAIDNKATINVSNLPAGVYLVDCVRDGVKIATAKFIKN
jgi:hypothetical protein